MHALTRPVLPPAWAPQRRANLARSARPRLARARRCASLTPFALDPSALAAALAAALGGVTNTAEAVASITPENAAAAVAGAVSLSAAALSARDAVAGDGDGSGTGSSGGGGGGGSDGGDGGDAGQSRGEGDFWHRNALPSFVCAFITAALLRAHEDAAAAAFGWASLCLLLLPLPFTLEVVLVCGIFVYVVRRRALAAAEEK